MSNILVGTSLYVMGIICPPTLIVIDGGHCPRPYMIRQIFLFFPFLTCNLSWFDLKYVSMYSRSPLNAHLLWSHFICTISTKVYLVFNRLNNMISRKVARIWLKILRWFLRTDFSVISWLLSGACLGLTQCSQLLTSTVADWAVLSPGV